MVKLFIYLLLTANHADGKWKGIDVKRGQLITGLKSLQKNTGLSIQNIRTCLSELEKTGEINKQSNTQFTVITINNYDSYNNVNDFANNQTNKPLTNEQQTNNKRSTTNKNEKNDKNEKNNIIARTQNFKSEVKTYLNTYSQEMLIEFFNYWSELNKSGTKMRYEMEKTWELSKRLQTWNRNESKYNKQYQRKDITDAKEYYDVIK